MYRKRLATSIVFENQRVTYGDFHRRVNRVANGLRADILADFPRSAAGKTLKRDLRERFRAGG